MRPKLTQHLIDKGYVTEDQCTEALQRQVVFGGRIGTNLLELFYITEEQLLEALSTTLHVPFIDGEQLKQIDPEVIGKIPEDLARKYKVVPFEAPKGRIHLAMTDPTNMEAIDEISFITGTVIKPFIVTELTMTFLLEKNYMIQRDRRFISIPEEEKKRRREWTERKEKEAAGQAVSMAETPEGLTSTPAAEGGAAIATVKPVAVAEPEEPAIDPTTFEGASEALARARNREDIAATLLTFANFRLERAILFIIKGQEVQAWKVGGVWKGAEHVGKIRFLFEEQTLIRQVADSRHVYRGPLLEIETHKKIIGTLGAPFPKEAVAFPMAIRKKVFSVLYGDNAISNDPFRELPEIQKIALKAALAFEVLILKAKILFQS